MKSSISKSKFRKNQKGQGMTEYIIIVALIAIAAIGVFGLFGNTIRAQVATMSQELGGNDGTQASNRAANEGNRAQAEGVRGKTLQTYGDNNAAKSQ